MKPALIIAAIALSLNTLTFAADIEIAPPTQSAKAHYDDARKSLGKNQWEQALSSLQKATALEPNNADIHNLLGYSYRKQGTLDKAFEHYRIALRLDPKHTGAHEYIGETYLLVKDLPGAEKHLATLASVCGKSCAEYQGLAHAIEDYKKKL